MSEAWSYVQNGTTQGPVSEEALRGYLASGKLGPEDLVWHQGMADWTKAGQLPELRLAPPPMSERNHFEPPRSAMLPDAESTTMNAQAAVASSLAALRATKPWVRFMGVMGILFTALMVIAGLIMSVLSKAGDPPALPGRQ